MASTTYDEEIVPYEYAVLKTDVHIRIMLLQPALDTTSPIHLSFLEDRFIDLEERYEALSYTWGEPKLTYPVYVENGKLLFVTKNLDEALRRLRHTSETRWLWADALCINQNDDKEKETQIPRMVDIFQNARRVLAWLGPGSESLGQCMRNLRVLSRTPRGAVDAHMQRILNRDETIPNPAWAYFSDSILDLLSLPWFNRLWIIQELVFNVDVILICGTFELPWTRLVAGASILMNTLAWDPDSDALRKMDAIQKTSDLWRYHCFIGERLSSMPQPPDKISSKPDHDIIDLIERFSDYGCTDPRDRIFALYSMARNILPAEFPGHPGAENSIIMDIDYSLNVQQTYQTFAVACLKSGRVDKILTAAVSRLYAPIAQDWPSWIPDWRIKAKKPEPNPNVFGASVEYISQNKVFLSMDCMGSSTPSFFGLPVEQVFSLERLEDRWAFFSRLQRLHIIHCLRRGTVTSLNMLNYVKSYMSSEIDISSTAVPEQFESTSAAKESRRNSLTEYYSVLEEPTETKDYDYVFSVTVRHATNSTTSTIFGHAKVPLQTDDKIIACPYSPLENDMLNVPVANALILRPTPTAASSPSDGELFVSFRLVGSAILLADHGSLVHACGTTDIDRRVYLCLE